jgi:hypothetical protein
MKFSKRVSVLMDASHKDYENWAAINIRGLWPHRHHEVVREAIRHWLTYAKRADGFF